ncbi:unnamed protein product [Rotaria sp. Silwood1]|nr:unnamed protein product [Rotaria sp. Silwood1]CAF1191303.1 unnamed protein product [Rotaria sp. Silwood1]CAF3471124.1 unnamed protein product [Rotaria sp. Silwood1]CAF4651654.1 unnamed protein product [Rotaria sp. Silwood1]
MSIEAKDENVFEIVWLGKSSDKIISEMNIRNKFTDDNQLKEYIIDKNDCSIIVIQSSSISFDIKSLIQYPQICAIYDEKFVCLYCLPRMISSIDIYLKNQQQDKIKKKCEQSYLSNILSIVGKYWFLIGLLISILLGYCFPNVGKTGGYIRSEWTVKYGCIIFIFFLSGLSLQTRQLTKEIFHIRLHLFIQVYSFIIIPFLVYALSLLLSRTSMNKILIFGIIIMASMSTTGSSNVIMTKNALGNEYAALLNAIVGNILGTFISPALLFVFMKNPIFDLLSKSIYGQDRLNYSHVIKKLSLIILLPLFLGQIIHLLWTKKIIYLRDKFYFSQLNSVALLIVVWSVFSTAFSNQSFQTMHKKDLLILILIDAFIYILFSLLIFLIARLPIRYWQFSEKDTVAILFCASMKSLAMGISLINALYDKQYSHITSLLPLPLIIYHALQLIIGAIQGILLKNWIEKKFKKKSTKTLKDKNYIQSTYEDKFKTDESQTINVTC